MIRHIFFALLVFFISSCNSSLDKGALIKELDSIQTQWEQKEYVIFIPVKGCSSCVGKAFQFLSKNLMVEEFSFILFDHNSEKEIKIRFHLDEKSIERIIFIEHPNDLIALGISDFYPTIVKTKNKDLSIQVADPYHLSYWEEIQP